MTLRQVKERILQDYDLGAFVDEAEEGFSISDDDQITVHIVQGKNEVVIADALIKALTKEHPNYAWLKTTTYSGIAILAERS